jgi:hypothetical protein
LFNGLTCRDGITGLLSATQGEECRRSKPIGQDRESFPAGMTDSAPYPNAIMPVIVR